MSELDVSAAKRADSIARIARRAGTFKHKTIQDGTKRNFNFTAETRARRVLARDERRAAAVVRRAVVDRRALNIRVAFDFDVSGTRNRGNNERRIE